MAGDATEDGRDMKGNLYSSSAYNVKWEVSIGQRTCFSSPVFNDDSHEFPSTTPWYAYVPSGDATTTTWAPSAGFR